MFKKDIKLMVLILSAMFWGSGVLANEVYIEQAGDSSTFNITQSGTGSNRVGTAGTPSTFSGNGQTVDIVQAGQLNAADLSVNGGSTTINYSASGDSNELLINIDGGTGNTLNVVKTGDNNRVTMCGANNVGVAGQTGATATCSSGVAVNDTTNSVNITGDSNKVNLALASANAVNTINIGQTTLSTGNIVNITQTSTGIPTTNLAIDGNTNTVNIKQQ